MRDAKRRAVAGFPPSPPFDRAGWSCMPRRLCVASVHRRGLIRWGREMGSGCVDADVASFVAFARLLSHIRYIHARVSNCRSLAGPAPSLRLMIGVRATNCTMPSSLESAGRRLRSPSTGSTKPPSLSGHGLASCCSDIRSD